jgi:serine/threonine protein kinase
MATEKNSKPDKYVAIKVVGTDGYAEREASILSDLMTYSHPNIIKLFGRYEPGPDECARTCLVLSLARGPTLNYILEKGGALGLIMAKAISRQLIRAVAFLHGHAVIHRDIQPCNLIVSGTSMDDDLWWSNEFDVDGTVLGFVQRCHVTLIDVSALQVIDTTDW